MDIGLRWVGIGIGMVNRNGTRLLFVDLGGNCIIVNLMQMGLWLVHGVSRAFYMKSVLLND